MLTNRNRWLQLKRQTPISGADHFVSSPKLLSGIRVTLDTAARTQRFDALSLVSGRALLSRLIRPAKLAMRIGDEP
jgi:hypothetical protein